MAESAHAFVPGDRVRCDAPTFPNRGVVRDLRGDPCPLDGRRLYGVEFEGQVDGPPIAMCETVLTLEQPTPAGTDHPGQSTQPTTQGKTGKQP